MNKRILTIAAACTGLLVTVLLGSRLGSAQEQQQRPGTGFAAVPGLKGGQDVFGPYDPVQGWPKPLAESLPDHEGWTWSQATDVFVENPDRILVAQKGELPVLPRQIPLRGPGCLRLGPASSTRWAAVCRCVSRPVLHRAHGIEPTPMGATADRVSIGDGSTSSLCFDSEGNMIEDWSQWDSIWGRPHDIEISPLRSGKTCLDRGR